MTPDFWLSLAAFDRDCIEEALDDWIERNNGDIAAAMPPQKEKTWG